MSEQFESIETDGDDWEPPDLEDELADLAEDMMLYPQDHSIESMEAIGLTLDDVYPPDTAEISEQLPSCEFESDPLAM